MARSSAGSTGAWSSARGRSGSRSIIGDPRNPRMQADMNIKIKFREGFRPFAPSVLRERVSDYFELDCESPYMLLVAPVKKERQIPLSAEQRTLWGIEKLNVPQVRHSGGDAHRLFGTRPDGLGRDQPELPCPHPCLRGPYGLRRDRQYVVQRSRRADRLHPRGRIRLLHAHPHRLPGARVLSPG